MLRDQHVAGFSALLVHATYVRHHVALEQVEQPANGVKQHSIVAGLGDRQVKACVRRTLFGTTHLFVTRIAVL
ncbi:hypothetical protein D3C81_1458260 [compost metagenome]